MYIGARYMLVYVCIHLFVPMCVYIYVGVCIMYIYYQSTLLYACTYTYISFLQILDLI